MTIFVEGHLLFDFGPGWRVEKYDEHPIYRDGLEHLKEQIPCKHCLHAREVGSKAVDFVGVYRGQPYFIEVKDFRGHEVENRRRITQGDLASEVALKVRDTLAGLLGICRHQGWQQMLAPLLDQAPTVLLWLEEDTERAARTPQSHEASNLGKLLKRRLGWLNPYRVLVVNRDLVLPAYNLRVRSLPDRVFKLRKRLEPAGAGTAQKPAPVSLAQFCDAWSVPSQEAGAELKRLCDKGILARAPGAEERYAAGPSWESLLDE